MNQEILFAKTLEDVKKLAKEQGNIVSKEQVEDAFSSLHLNGEQLEMVFDFLKKHKIGIGEPADLDDYLSEEEIDYLKEYTESLKGFDDITDGEKEALLLSAMAGEKSAQSKLIQVTLPQVVDIAKLYAGQGVYVEDLIGQGNMALSEGVTMLGCEDNAKDAQGMLIRIIMNAMEELVGIDLEEHGRDQKIADKVNEIADKARELAQEMRRSVTPKELADETGISEDEIWDAYRLSGYRIEDIDGGKK